MVDYEPRRAVEPDPIRELRGLIRNLTKDVEKLRKTSSIRNASVTDDAGNRMRFEDSALVWTNSAGVEYLRAGLLVHTTPGSFGVESFNGSVWTKLT